MSFPQPNFPVWVNRPRDIPKTLGEFHIELFGWPSDIYQTYPEYQTHQCRAIAVHGSDSCTTMLLRNTSSCLSSSGRKCSTPDFWWYLNFRFLTTCGSNSPTFTHKPAIYTDASMLTVARNEISIVYIQGVYPIRCQRQVLSQVPCTCLCHTIGGAVFDTNLGPDWSFLQTPDVVFRAMSHFWRCDFLWKFIDWFVHIHISIWVFPK